MRWKSKYSDAPYEKLPSSPSSAIKIVMLKFTPILEFCCNLLALFQLHRVNVSGVPVLSDVSIIT